MYFPPHSPAKKLQIKGFGFYFLRGVDELRIQHSRLAISSRCFFFSLPFFWGDLHPRNWNIDHTYLGKAECTIGSHETIFFIKPLHGFSRWWNPPLKWFLHGFSPESTQFFEMGMLWNTKKNMPFFSFNHHFQEIFFGQSWFFGCTVGSSRKEYILIFFWGSSNNLIS